MKRFLSILLVAFVSLFVITGCGKDEKSPTGPGGGNPVTLNENAGALEAHAGANAVITDSVTAAQVGGTVQSQSMEAMGKAMSLMGQAKKLAGGNTGTINGTINGTKSGTATTTGSYTYNQSTNAILYDIVCTFSNYSEDGLLFLGGMIHYDVNMVMPTGGAGDPTGTMTITGKIRFNGSYLGTNSFTLVVTMGATSSTYTYTSTIVSDGKTITTSFTQTEQN